MTATTISPPSIRETASAPAGRPGGETFFYKEDLGTLTISPDAEGHVIGYTYRQVDGQEIPSQKIK